MQQPSGMMSQAGCPAEQRRQVGEQHTDGFDRFASHERAVGNAELQFFVVEGHAAIIIVGKNPADHGAEQTGQAAQVIGQPDPLGRDRTLEFVPSQPEACLFAA